MADGIFAVCLYFFPTFRYDKRKNQEVDSMIPFPEVKKNFGFGMMRLPMQGDQVDMDATKEMVDAFLAAGFNYFDTAHPYLSGQSEDAVKICISSRYPREKYLLADKLSGGCFETEADILPLFEKQLQKCGVDYFDFYLMHAMSAARHEKYTQTHAYDIAAQLKAEGKIRHVGMSFHDSAEVLDKILSDRPELEFVQLQLNYADWEDPKVQARQCWEVCRKHNKPIVVMEPVKGGSLVNLPEKAKAGMTASPASYAIRYAAGTEGVFMVLSGMSNQEQMDDNLSYMTNFVPLNEEEQQLISRVRTLYQAQHRIPCTACSYCTDGCPAGIPIPEIFTCMNDKRQGQGEPEKRYGEFENNASACVGCGQCEEVCPQHLKIRELLAEVAKEF